MEEFRNRVEKNCMRLGEKIDKYRYRDRYRNIQEES